MFKKLDLTETEVSSENVYSGKLLHVFRDKVSLADGKLTTREYIKHNGAVCIVALDDKKNVVLEHQFRYPFHREIIEVPAGKLDSKDEVPLEAAKRELKEETGLTAENYRYIGPIYPSVAYTDEVIHMYIATGLKEGDRKLDEHERINIEYVPLKQAVDMVLSGEIGDSKTQAALLKAWILGV